MDLHPLPSHSANALQDRAVPSIVMAAVRLVVTCLDEACAWVADDCSPAHYDDATSEGQLRWRRTRNYVKELLDDQAIPELFDAVADISDNALQIRADSCAVSFYSAREGIENPDLSGRSRTKGRVVTEMQLQLEGIGPPEAPRRLVVLYEADRDGLARASVGMLDSSTDWAWNVTAYERSALAVGTTTRVPAERGLAYDEQPEVELPPITPLEEGQDAEHGESN
jgi:hypothetical protein